MVYVGECAVYMTGLAGLRRIITVSGIFRCECIGVLYFIALFVFLGFPAEVLK